MESEPDPEGREKQPSFMSCLSSKSLESQQSEETRFPDEGKRAYNLRPRKPKTENPKAIQKKLYVCTHEMCTFKASSKTMIQHIVGHHTDKKYLIRTSFGYCCRHCNYQTYTESEIINHLLTEEHNKNHFSGFIATDKALRYFVCHICKKLFENFTSFETHQEYEHKH